MLFCLGNLPPLQPIWINAQHFHAGIGKALPVARIDIGFVDKHIVADFDDLAPGENFFKLLNCWNAKLVGWLNAWYFAYKKGASMAFVAGPVTGISVASTYEIFAIAGVRGVDFLRARPAKG